VIFARLTGFDEHDHGILKDSSALCYTGSWPQGCTRRMRGKLSGGYLYHQHTPHRGSAGRSSNRRGTRSNSKSTFLATCAAARDEPWDSKLNGIKLSFRIPYRQAIQHPRHQTTHVVTRLFHPRQSSGVFSCIYKRGLGRGGKGVDPN